MTRVRDFSAWLDVLRGSASLKAFSHVTVLTNASHSTVGSGRAKREPDLSKPDRRPRAHLLIATRCVEIGKQAGRWGSAHQAPSAPIPSLRDRSRDYAAAGPVTRPGGHSFVCSPSSPRRWFWLRPARLRRWKSSKSVSIANSGVCIAGRQRNGFSFITLGRRAR